MTRTTKGQRDQLRAWLGGAPIRADVDMIQDLLEEHEVLLEIVEVAKKYIDHKCSELWYPGYLCSFHGALEKLEGKERVMEQTKPKVVVIIGSTRFKEHHLGAAQRETLKGKIVLTAGFFHHRDYVPISSEQKAYLDWLAERKVDLADEVYVVNINGYVGETTQRLIDYATKHGKPIDSIEPLGQGPRS